MERWTVILTILVACLAAGYGVGHREAEAAVVPPACPKYECKNTHGWWNATIPNDVFAVYTQMGNNEVDGIEDIFTPDSDAKKPRAETMVTVAWKIQTTCSPHCGKDPTDNKWQSRQTVSPTGTPPDDYVEFTQDICAAAGGIGPQSGNQANNNPNGTVPPQAP